VLEAIIEGKRLLFELIVRTALVASYLLIMPLVHIESQRKLRRRIGRLHAIASERAGR
jgi:hypothetical protein